jgi:hypothetical protein
VGFLSGPESPGESESLEAGDEAKELTDQAAQFLTLFHDSALGDPNVISRGVLHQIHHLVGLTDNVVGIAGIMGIGG